MWLCNVFIEHPWIRGGEAPDNPIDSAVLSRLKQYRAMNKLKKLALKVKETTNFSYRSNPSLLFCMIIGCVSCRLLLKVYQKKKSKVLKPCLRIWILIKVALSLTKNSKPGWLDSVLNSLKLKLNNSWKLLVIFISFPASILLP